MHNALDTNTLCGPCVKLAQALGKREGREFESWGLQTHEFFFFSFFPPTCFFFLFISPMKLISAFH